MYTKVTCEGIPVITDGRVFVIDGQRLDPPGFELATEVEEVAPVSSASRMNCSVCGKGLERLMIGHNLMWMYTAFGCRDHLEAVCYLDIFPKVDPEMTHDWVNSFMGLDTGQERFEGIVTGMTYPDEVFKNLLAGTTAEATLTPEGLKVRRSFLRRMLPGS